MNNAFDAVGSDREGEQFIAFVDENLNTAQRRIYQSKRWKDEAGKAHEVPAQEWIRDTRTQAAMKERWVFVGSGFWKDPDTGEERYQADGGDFICLSNFPTAMLDLPIASTQSNEALLFEVFPDRVPPVGTEIELVLSAAVRAGSGR